MMSFREVNTFLHRWLGLVSGIVVLIVSLTGALLVFEEEFDNLQSPWLKVEARSTEKLPPSVLMNAATGVADTGMTVTAVQYGWESRSTAIHLRGAAGQQTLVYVDPYSGNVIQAIPQETDHDDFFHLMEEGHIHLWLPENVGRPIVRYGTLIFILMLITGLIWWFPAKWTRGTREKSFLIKWKAGWKRLTIDLHNVTGFYLLLLALLLAVTGIYFSFDWVGNSMRWVTTGGQPYEKAVFPTIEENQAGADTALFADQVYEHVLRDTPSPANLFIALPATPESPFMAAVNKHKISSHTTRLRFFDQYSGKEIYKTGAETGKTIMEDVDYRVMLYNYNLHLGRIGGLPTKILAFVAALLCASLPVTGFIVWLNKQRKNGSRK